MNFAILLALLLFPRVAFSQVSVAFWEETGVRESFVWDGKHWESFADSKSGVKAAPTKNWNVYFDGKTFGNITTSTPSAADKALLKVEGATPKVTFRTKQSKFSGWNGPIIRPVVLTSQRQVSDPDTWKKKPGMPPAKDMIATVKSKLNPIVHFCKTSDCEEEEKIKRPIKDSEIVTRFTYQDHNGNALIALAPHFVATSKAYCETEGDLCEGLGAYWFRVPKSGPAVFLTQAQALIDTVDLNDDGHSEMIFWISEYNRDGYRLIDGRTYNSVDMSWEYH